MSDMKLIMENWRSYVETLEYEEPKVFLFEGKEKKSEKNLSLLFEEADKGLLTEEEVLQAWRQTVLYESQQLINEGVMDALKRGWAAMKKGGKWLTDKVIAAYNWAAKKFNDFIVNVWGGINLALIKAAGSIKSNMYISSALEDLSVLNDKIQDLRNAHPVIFKASVVILTVGVVAAVMASMSSEAQAVVKLGKQELSERNINAMKGLLQAACEHDPQMCSSTNDLIQDLNNYATKAQGGEGFAKGGIDAKEVLQLAGKGMSDAEQTLSLTNKWWKEVVENYNENVELFQKMKKKFLAQNPGATKVPGDSPLAQQMQHLEELQESLNTIIENGKKSTLRTVERVISTTAEGKDYVSSEKSLGGMPKGGLDQALGRGAAQAYGEPVTKAVRHVRGF